MLDPTMVYYDNQNCIRLSENLVVHDLSNHIASRYHFLYDRVQKETMDLEYVYTDHQVG